MNIGIVIPAHNEAAFLSKTLNSLLTQTKQASNIVLVNDNSTDNTGALMDELAAAHQNIVAVHLTSEAKHLPGSKVVKAFLEGLKSLDPLPDIICKFDADLIFPPNYLQAIESHFIANPNLGMVGGFCYVDSNGRWELESLTGKDHIRGALKAYRKDCYMEIGGLNPSMGWDTADELLARFNGWDVTTDSNLKVLHLRPTGKNYHEQSRCKQGEAFRKLGYDYWLTSIAAAKGAWKRKSMVFYFDTMKGFKNYRGPLLVNDEQARFVRNYRWKGIKQKLFGTK